MQNLNEVHKEIPSYQMKTKCEHANIWWMVGQTDEQCENVVPSTQDNKKR